MTRIFTDESPVFSLMALWIVLPFTKIMTKTHFYYSDYPFWVPVTYKVRCQRPFHPRFHHSGVPMIDIIFTVLYIRNASLQEFRYVACIHVTQSTELIFMPISDIRITLHLGLFFLRKKNRFFKENRSSFWTYYIEFPLRHSAGEV